MTLCTYSNLGPQLGVGAREVLTTLNGQAHAGVDRLPVGTTEQGTRPEQSQRVVVCTGIVDRDVPQHVLCSFVSNDWLIRDNMRTVNLLREVDVDAQEVG